MINISYEMKKTYSTGDKWENQNGQIIVMNTRDIALIEAYLILQGLIFDYLHCNGRILNVQGGGNCVVLSSPVLNLYSATFKPGNLSATEVFKAINQVKTPYKSSENKIKINAVLSQNGSKLKAIDIERQ